MENRIFRNGSVLKVTRKDTKEDIERQFALMRDCGMNTAVIWPAVFRWEEKGDNYPFATGKMILDLAEKYGIAIIMELAGQLSVFEYIPDSEMKKDFHPINEFGAREFGQSSFGFLSYFNPEVDKLIKEHFSEVARAYKDHPALIGYDIFNETMFRSHDEYTVSEFRRWLKNKYKTVEKLNEVWERTYSSFDEVEYESWKWMSIMPEADYGAFRKDAISIFLKGWRDAILKEDSSHLIIADNIHSQVAPGCDYKRPQDDFGLKEVADEIGMSFYPKQVNGTMGDALRHEIFDAFYASSRREGFYISEMQTHIQALFNPTTCVKPYELKRWCLEAYSAGAKSMIYWMWRPFTKGLQTLGRGLVDYKDRPTERYNTAKELSEIFNKYGVPVPEKSKVGILYDALADDFTRAYTSSYAVDKNVYLLSVFGAYKALFDIGCRADIITFSELSDYDTVIATNSVVVDNERAELLKSFVRSGGNLIVDGRFGVVNSESELNFMLPGGEANEIIGAEYFDTDGERAEFELFGVRVKCREGRERVKLNGAKVLSTFSSGDPSVIESQYGNGKAITFNLSLWHSYAKDSGSDVCEMLKCMLKHLDISYPKCDSRLKIRIVNTQNSKLLFAFNYTNEKINTKIILDDADITEVDVDVAPNDVKIIEL